jgi:hypothetical protein
MLGRRQRGFIIGEEPLVDGADRFVQPPPADPRPIPAAPRTIEPSEADDDQAGSPARPPRTARSLPPTAAGARAAIALALAGLLLAVLLASALAPDRGSRPVTAREHPAGAGSGHVDHGRARLRTSRRAPSQQQPAPSTDANAPASRGAQSNAPRSGASLASGSVGKDTQSGSRAGRTAGRNYARAAEPAAPQPRDGAPAPAGSGNEFDFERGGP